MLIRGEEVKGDKAYIRLETNSKTIIEVLPKDLTKHIEI